MRKGNLTPRTITAPLAAFTMACILFAYTRSSIRTARDQAVRLPPSSSHCTLHRAHVSHRIHLPGLLLTLVKRYGNGHGNPRPPPPDSSSS
ncbi:hypothetical protein CI238_00167 [Colletotrichum incanum]|uniref:Uncharacterized protein n=1 Tax=Colletotrichum incanum TaxID=1573173 RepID=A0A166QXW0_COLIC|nr:hypothetical protein CI238_00167 [Colletotrichum incanum]